MSENTLAKPGEFDALEKARPDELIFPLLERDPDAPPTILHWVDLRRTRARAEIADLDKLKDELRQCTEAEFLAFAMQARQRGKDGEAVPTSRPTYSGIIIETSAIDDLIAKLRAMLGDADFHAHEAADLMRRILATGGELPHSIGDELAAAAATIHRITLELSPHRAALLAEGDLPLAVES